MVKNPNWSDANQLAKWGRGLDSGLPKTNPANGQTGNWTRGLRISSPAPLPLGNAASYKTTNYSYKTTTFPCSLKQNKQAKTVPH